MKFLKSLILSIYVALLMPASYIAMAAIASPTSYGISSVTAYSPALEAGDQFFIVQYSITYGSIPTTDAGQAWLIRLKENGTEVASTTPYAFYNSGYTTGVASIYLPASLAVTWGGNVTMVLEPNPLLDWSSIPAQEIFQTIVWSSANTFDEVSTAVGAEIRAKAIGMNITWSATTNPLIEAVNGIMKLTDRGAAYFDVAIPTLRTMQPNLYQSLISMPNVVERSFGDNGTQEMDTRLVGTPFDLSDVATDWGISRMWATGAIWGAACLAGAGTLGYFAQSAKPTFFLFGGLMMAGGFMGFGLLQTILFALLGIGSIVLAFAWRGA